MTLDPATFDQLLSPLGERALHAATALAPTDANCLAVSDRLRKQFPPALARAAIETVLLRKKAAVKFSRADRMFFTREALEVASGETVSRYRAERFRAFAVVGDFACGVGGDVIGLASAGVRVEAVDRDPVRLRMAEANLAVYDLAASGRFHLADVLTDPLPAVPAAFADPGRRADGKRFLAVRDYLPPPHEVLKRLPPDFPIGFKLAPGVAVAELEPFGGEIEFISASGELKECALWLGGLRTTGRRATVLTREGDRHTLAAEVTQYPSALAPVGAYLYDPDPAVTRAGLVPTLAASLGFAAVDYTVQLLTAGTHTPTPFATAYRVDDVLPFDAKKVSAALRGRNVGRVTVVNRGSLADVEAATRKWKLAGEEHRFVLLTREAGRQVAVVGDRV